MFINTKKAFKINADTNAKNGLAFEAKAGWIGEVPKWVEKHWFFKALCKDGTVTAIVSSHDKDIQDAVEQEEQGEQEQTPEEQHEPKSEPKPKTGIKK